MPNKAHHQSLAHRLGRVLERVTRQSGRLQETPAYGSLLLGRVTESQQRRRIRIQVILTVVVMVVNLIGMAVAALLVDGRHSRTEHLRRRAGVADIRSNAGLSRLRHGRGHVLDHPTDGAGAALGDRGAQTDPPRRAQHLPGPVAGRGRRPEPVDPRDARCSPPSTAWSTRNSSRGFCSAWAFAVFSSPPRPTCLPSSRCDRWPPRRSRLGDRHGG